MGVFSDNFDRADQVLTADNRWATLEQSGLRIVSNKLVDSAGGTGKYYAYFTGGFANDQQFSQATIAHLTAGDRLALILRADPNSLNYYVALLQSSTIASINRSDAGAATPLASTGVATLAGGDIFKFSVAGNGFSLYQNGVLLLAATDATYSTGNPGIGYQDIGSGDGTGAWDGWSGGDNSSVRAGVFSKDRVLYVGSFDAGILPNYGLFDDDFVDQSDGTTVGATVSGMTSTCAGMFDRDANLFGMYGAS